MNNYLKQLFVVKPEKTEEFKSLKPNLEIRQKNENLVEKLENSALFSDELITVLKNKEERNSVNIMKKIVDGESKNIDPLKEMPEPQMRLYGFSSAFKSAYFDTEEELIEYVKNNNTDFGCICIMDYLGKVAGCSDVIRKTYKEGHFELFTAVGEYDYGIYNNERSIYRGDFVWEVHHGSISTEYSAFRDRGIIFENDIYDKIDERNQKIYKLIKDSWNERINKDQK